MLHPSTSEQERSDATSVAPGLTGSKKLLVARSFLGNRFTCSNKKQLPVPILTARAMVDIISFALGGITVAPRTVIRDFAVRGDSGGSGYKVLGVLGYLPHAKIQVFHTCKYGRSVWD